MITPISMALVGAGRIASVYAEVLGKCDAVQVVAVVDPVLEAAQALATELDCPAYQSHHEVDGAEAALVCTPPATHPAIVHDLLSMGINVLCEKPLAVSLADAQGMLTRAMESGAILTMASKFRYAEDVIRARNIMASGILGEIILIENTFASRVDMTKRWNSDPAISGGGVLIDNGTHSVDVMRYLMGPIAEVRAVEGRRAQSVDVEDTAQIFLRNHEGVRATIDLSWTIDKERDSYLDIYGSEGTVRVGWKESRYRQSSSPNWVVFGHGYDKLETLTAQVRNFCRAIRGLEPLVIDAIDALASVSVIAAAYSSMRADNWVPVDLASQTALAV